MTAIEDDLTRALREAIYRHERPDDQSDCTCGHYYDIEADGNPLLWPELHRAHLAAVLAPIVAKHVAAGQEQALLDAALRVERLRRRNPMNGDGHNTAIDSALRALDSQADSDAPSTAAEWERARLNDEDDVRVCAVNGWEPPARSHVDRLRDRAATYTTTKETP